MQQYYRMAAAAVAWFALVLQYYLTITKPGTSLIEATIRYFSFFTILANILVALALTLPWLAPNMGTGRFLDRPSARTAILSYIIIVAVIYHYLLAKLWNPQGWQLLTRYDRACRDARALCHRLGAVRAEGDGQPPSSFHLARLSLVYTAYSLIHGAATGFYPYPFINVREFGYDKIFLNMGVLLLVFIALSLALIAIDRRIGIAQTKTAASS